jgi:outer membrane receptor for ferric coprogen and ferric-rhodotorulic acid
MTYNLSISYEKNSRPFLWGVRHLSKAFARGQHILSRPRRAKANKTQSKHIRTASFLLLLCGALVPTALTAEVENQGRSSHRMVAQQASAGDFVVPVKAPVKPLLGIEEVVIYGAYVVNDRLDTATGLGLTLQETPQSVSIMTFQRIEDQNLQSLTDIVRNAAGVSAINTDSSRDQYSARGFEIENYQLDGVPIAWSAGSNAGETQTSAILYERIEIVRGATGLLTGAGNPSASINLVRKHADSQALTGYASIEASRWNTYSVSADVSAPLNVDGAVRGRIVARYEDGDSFRQFASNEESIFYGVVDVDITDSTLLRAGVSYQNNNPTADTWGGLSSWYSDGTRTDWNRSKNTAAKWTSWGSINKNYFVNLIHGFANGWQAKVNVNQYDNTADPRLLYLYGEADQASGLGLGPFSWKADIKNTQTSIDFQFSGSFRWLDREHELTFGYIDSDQGASTYTYQASNEAPVGSFNQWDGSYPEPGWANTRDLAEDYTVRQTAYYFASRLMLTESLKVILGARMTDWEQKGESYDTTLPFGEEGVFVPYAGILYDVADNHTLYTSYTEIFKPQFSQDRKGNFLDPLIGKSYELGFKSVFFSNSLHTTVAHFKIEQDNLAQPDTGYLVPGTLFEASRAAPGVESEGFELEMVGELSPGWDVSFSYTQFTAEDSEGNGVNTRYPHKLLKLFTTYRFTENLTLGGGVNWEDSNYTDTFNPVTNLAERLEQKSYGLVNLMARYDFSSQMTAQVNIDNVLDETYYSQIGFFDQYAYGEPRNISMGLKYQF